MSLPPYDGLKLMAKAIENDKKDKLYQQYCHLVVFMDRDSFVTFNEFYKQCTKKVKKVTKKEAYSNAENILSKVLKG